MDTPFEKLYYYVFWSDSMIDKSIKNALKHKKNFSERTFLKRFIAREKEKQSDELDRKWASVSSGKTAK